MWLWKFKLNIIKIENIVFTCTHHISSAHQSHVAIGYCVRKYTYRRFFVFIIVESAVGLRCF